MLTDDRNGSRSRVRTRTARTGRGGRVFPPEAVPWVEFATPQRLQHLIHFTDDVLDDMDAVRFKFGGELGLDASADEQAGLQIVEHGQ